MPYPKKLEINIENDAQLAILYSCFNVCTNEVIQNMKESCNEKIEAMASYFEDALNKPIVEKYLSVCWKKVDDMLTTTLTVPKFSVLLAALEKSGITKEVVNKKNSKDNIAKIVVEVNEVTQSVKILGFKNIKRRDELPSNYFLEFPYFYKNNDESFVVMFLKEGQKQEKLYGLQIHSEHNFYTGEMYDSKKFAAALLAMKEAGKRLTQINREEKQLSIPKLSVTKEFSI